MLSRVVPACRASHLSGLLIASLLCPAAERFPKPDPEKALSEYKVYERDGSPLSAATEDWEGAKRLVASDAGWRTWVSERRAETDEWMAKRTDRVEWIAGWWHDYVSPRDGAFLPRTPDPPGEFMTGAAGERVEVTPKIFGGWVFTFRSAHQGMMLEAARLYRLTGDTKYRDWAAGQLDFYAANYMKWPVQTLRSKSRLMHQSLDEANALTRFAQTARTLGDAIPPQKRKYWFEELFKPMALLLEETFQRVHNIACWQRAAEAQAALYGGDEELWKQAIDGEYGIRRQIRDGVTSDYFWLEQSLGYNSYVVSALLPLFEHASLAGRAAELRAEMAAAQNLMLAPIAIRFPDGKLPTPADSTGAFAYAPNRQMLASAYRVFPTGIGLEEAAKRKSWATLLQPPRPVKAPAPPEVRSALLRSTQFAVLRNGSWQIFFHYGQLDPSHAQAEALNFEAYWRNQDITHDPGTVGYGSPLHRGFYQTGLAHNVPLINGQGQARWAEGEVVEFDAAKPLIKARQKEYRPGWEAARTLSIEGGALKDILEVKGAETARIGLLLHLQGEVDAAVAMQAAPSPFQYFEATRKAATAGVFEAKMGGRRLRVSAGAPMTVWLGTTPDAPPNRRATLYFEVEGQAARFETVMQ